MKISCPMVCYRSSSQYLSQLYVLFLHIWFHSLWNLGNKQQLGLKLQFHNAIECSKKELNDKMRLHEKSEVYQDIAAKYPMDLQVITLILWSKQANVIFTAVESLVYTFRHERQLELTRPLTSSALTRLAYTCPGIKWLHGKRVSLWRS